MLGNVEQAVFMAPLNAENPSGYWAVIDSDYCPWSEVYSDGNYTDENRVRPYFDVEHRPNANSRTAIALAEPSSDDEDESDSACSDESSAEGEYAVDSDDEDPDNDADDDGFAIAELGEM